METNKLKKFAQLARRSLIEQVSTKLEFLLAEESAARRESVEAIRKLEEAIRLKGKEQVIERVAYIWFNRFCALRFMDVNRYNRVGIVSPADPSQFQPEILAEAKMGHVDEDMVHERVRQHIFALLAGKAPSRDAQGEVYRLLLVAACNDLNKAMPFLFQRIDDYTELLMPDDLLSGNSILAHTREAMTPEACKDVEVIGWLYQFYISEKKDEVFEGLKRNRKISPENIPAATQLFTPHWIVRYLVENSLGRLWLLNRPGSKLAERMDYYIRPEQAESDFLRIEKPEDIRICDPACGSGHMLTYAFDLLYAIYEEEGYDSSEIPEKILTHNLYGIEIDERAGELAAFALTMKARARQRRFFSKGIRPNICVLENIFVESEDLISVLKVYGIEHPERILAPVFDEFPELTCIRKTFKSLLDKYETGFEVLKVNPSSGVMVNWLRQGLAEWLDLYQEILENPGAKQWVINWIETLTGSAELEAVEPKLNSLKEAIENPELPPCVRKWAKQNIARLNSRTQIRELPGRLTEWRAYLDEICANEKAISRLKKIESKLIQQAEILACLRATLHQFEESDNFGSLIKPDIADLAAMQSLFKSVDFSGQWYESVIDQKIKLALHQVEYVSPIYHVVIANPPYMGSKGMNWRLGELAKDNYPSSKSDLFAMFIERNLELAISGGMVAMITMQSWMFLSTFTSLRALILNHHTILSMAHLGARAFDSIGGEVVSTTAFVLENTQKPEYKGAYIRLVDGNSEDEKMKLLVKAIAENQASS